MSELHPSGVPSGARHLYTISTEQESDSTAMALVDETSSREQARPLKHAPAATISRRRPDARLLVLSRETGAFEHARLTQLGDYLRAGDLLVVNDAATLPGSLKTHRCVDGRAVEFRLMASLAPMHSASRSHGPARWLALAFGSGDWRQRTEDREAPPVLSAYESFLLPSGVLVRIAALRPESGRLVELEFDTDSRWNGNSIHDIYENGAPIQYAYHEAPLALWDHQTLFANQPVALEPPSAAMHLSWHSILTLMKRGVRVATVTHATGISSTGDVQLDGLLPVPEQSYVPGETLQLIEETRRAGGRVIALGTGVVRALEDVAQAAGAQLRTYEGEGAREALLSQAGDRVASIRISPAHRLKLVDGIFTGMHTLDSSHLQLLGAFVSEEHLLTAYDSALDAGYLWHEYGDVNLIL